MTKFGTVQMTGMYRELTIWIPVERGKAFTKIIIEIENRNAYQ